MQRNRWRIVSRGLCVATMGVALAWGIRSSRGDQLVLNDGTTVEGTVITQGDKYWVKSADGKSRIIAKADVAKLVKGNGTATATPATPATAGGGATPATPPTPTLVGDIASVRNRAESCETAMAAVAVWQKYIDAKPSAADLAVAKAEQDKWQKMSQDGAEKVNGKWVTGEALKELHHKVDEKLRAAAEDMHGERTIQALKTLEEVRKMYPNSFEANFFTGYLTLLEHRDADAISYLEQAVKLRPDEPAALNNLGVALFATRKDLERGIVMMHKAATIEDNKEDVHNLCMALSLAPGAMKYNEKVRPAIESARLLAGKYGLSLQNGYQSDHWLLMAYQGKATRDAEFDDGQEHPSTAKVASGTGFIINDDGLILTNRHVVDGATSYLVILDGHVKKSGEIVIIDKDQDLALLRVKPDAKLPTVNFTDTATLNEGAACFAMGFPLIDRMGASIKVTQGIVSGTGREGVGADVVIDAKVNPGNSGGPLLDKYGRVIGIITMKTRAATFEDSYGLAIGAPHIREFLEKNNVKVANAAPGAASLSAEDVVAKVKPATVCIIATHDH